MKCKECLNIIDVSKAFFELKNRCDFLEERLSFCNTLLKGCAFGKITSKEQSSQVLLSVLSKAHLPEAELNITDLTAQMWEAFYFRNKNTQKNIKSFLKRFPTERDSFIFLCAHTAEYLFESYDYDDVNRLSMLENGETIQLLSEQEKGKLNIQVGRAVNLLELFTLMCYHIQRASFFNIYKNLDVYKALYEILSCCIRENTDEIERYYLLPTVTEISQTEKGVKKHT